MSSEAPRCGWNLILCEVCIDLIPYLGDFVEHGAGLHGPVMEGNSRLCADDTFRPNLPSPHLVMRRDDELSVWKMRSQKFAELLAVLCVHRHHHVIEDGEREVRAHDVLHEGQVQADAHAVLVALTMVGARRKHPLLVKVDA